MTTRDAPGRWSWARAAWMRRAQIKLREWQWGMGGEVNSETPVVGSNDLVHEGSTHTSRHLDPGSKQRPSRKGLP